MNVLAVALALAQALVPVIQWSGTGTWTHPPQSYVMDYLAPYPWCDVTYRVRAGGSQAPIPGAALDNGTYPRPVVQIQTAGDGVPGFFVVALSASLDRQNWTEYGNGARTIDANGDALYSWRTVSSACDTTAPQWRYLRFMVSPPPGRSAT